MRRISLDTAQKEWELLLQVCESWEQLSKFLDNLEILENEKNGI